MSTRELDRIEVMRRVQEKRLTRVKAGELLGLSARQARRLFKQFERLGLTALVSRKRGRPSNHRLPIGISRAKGRAPRKRAELAALAASEPAYATNRQIRKVVAVGYGDQGTEQNRSKSDAQHSPHAVLGLCHSVRYETWVEVCEKNADLRSHGRGRKKFARTDFFDAGDSRSDSMELRADSDPIADSD